MHTKLSMRNLQTFGQQSQDNPFTKQRSVSSKSRNDLELSNQQINNPFLRTNLKQKPTIFQKSQMQYQNVAMRDTTNIQPQMSRPNSNIKQGYQMGQQLSHSKHTYSSVSPFKPNKAPIQKNYTNMKLHNYSCDQIIHLLKNQKQSIERVKQTIESDKNKIQNHFNDFKQTINNIIQDLKLSISNNIDTQYQYFVNQFRIVKLQYTNYSNIKRQFWLMKQGQIQKAQKNTRLGQQPKFPGMINSNGKIQNEMLLMGVIQDLKDCKKHINYKQFEQVQQRLLKPLLLITKNMVKQMNIQSYYKPEIAYTAFKDIHKQIQKQMNKLHQRMDLFITDYLRDQQQYQKQLKKSKQKHQNYTNSYNHYRERDEVVTQRYKSPQFNKSKNKQAHHPNNICSPRQLQMNNRKQYKLAKQGQIYLNKKNSSPSVTQTQKQQSCYECEKQQPINAFAVTNGTNKQKYSSTAHSQFSTGDNFKKNINNYDQIKQNVCSNRYDQHGYATFSKNISNGNNGNNGNGDDKLKFNGEKLKKNKYRQRWSAQDGQNMQNSSKYVIKLQSTKPIIDKSYSNNKNNSSQQQTALCVSYLHLTNTIAVGTRNGLIKLFCTKTGTKLDQLHGHKAGICALSQLITDNTKNMHLLASGGDAGCNQVIVWDMNKAQIYHTFANHHSAAISSILVIDNGKYILSGGFDSLINIFSIRKKQLVKSINTQQKITILTKIQTKTHKQQQQCILSGHLNNTIIMWKIYKNSFNSVLGLQTVRKINIGTVPYSMAYIGNNQVMVTGKDNWVRVVDIGKGSISRAGQIGHCQQIIAININSSNRQKQGQVICMGCHKDGTISAICSQSSSPSPLQSKQQQLRVQYQIGKTVPLIYSCGISPSTTICHNEANNKYNTNYGYMFRCNHTNKYQTQIHAWNITMYKQAHKEDTDRYLYTY